MALLPSRKIFDLKAPPPSLAPPKTFKPASWPFVFAIGAATILAGAWLGLSIVVSGDIGFWIAVPFLAGLAPAAIFSRRCPSAAIAILFIAALPTMAIVWRTHVAPFGEIVALPNLGQIAPDRGAAGYSAPGWRIDVAHEAESEIRIKRGGVGVRMVAPLTAPGWTPDIPIVIWVAGYSYKSGKIGPTHPAHWSEPGEYARVVGSDLQQAQDAALHAAAAQGLSSIAEPTIVVHVDDASEAERAQRNELIAIVVAVLILWLVISFASARFEIRRAARRRER
jgi:hypothetical protein